MTIAFHIITMITITATTTKTTIIIIVMIIIIIIIIIATTIIIILRHCGKQRNGLTNHCVGQSLID